MDQLEDRGKTTIRGPGVEWGLLALGDFLNIPIELTGGSLVELCVGFQTACSDCI